MTAAVDTTLQDLESGRIRAAAPDPTAEDGWRVDPHAKAAILACFADRTTRTWEIGPLAFRDRVGVPPKDPARPSTRWPRRRPVGRGGWSRAERASAPERTSNRASSSCPRRSSTSGPGSGRTR